MRGPDGDALPVRRATLANGLRVVVAELPHLHEVHMVLSFRAGSRFESHEICGISHFLEHGLHAPELTHALEALGADLEAGTDADHCTFPLSLPPESLDEVSSLVARLLIRAPRGQHVEDERARVLEEIISGTTSEAIG